MAGKRRNNDDDDDDGPEVMSNRDPNENNASNNNNDRDDGKKNHNKYRRDKPWDNETIDHWKIDKWNDTSKGGKDALPGGRLLEESSFATLFPKYREHYLRQVWPIVTKTLDEYKIVCELNLIEGSMTVRTTNQTSDPYIILKARDVLKLLARSIPVTQALKILQDEYVCDIVKIGGLVRNKERFVKRRQRLVGPEGSTLKALELVTSCFILVQGNTVSIMGQSYTGLKHARQVILDCMNNIHPIYHIKRLMIMKELAQDEKLKNEDWQRFLPQFTKRTSSSNNSSTKKRKQPPTSSTNPSSSASKNNNNNEANNHNKKKKKFTPFPPAPTPRKVDLLLDSGEYFASSSQRQANQLATKMAKAKQTSIQKRQAYYASQDGTDGDKNNNNNNNNKKNTSKKDKKESASSSTTVDLEKLQANLKEHDEQRNRSTTGSTTASKTNSSNNDMSEYVQGIGNNGKKEKKQKDKKKKKN